MNQTQNDEVHEITKKATEHRKPVFDPTGRIESLMEGETKIFDLRRHVIGLIFLHIQITLGFGIACILTLFFMPTVGDLFNIASATVVALASMFILFIIGFGFIFLILATRIYEGNQLIVSDMNITLVHQVSLFNRQISELSLGNIEDVTARQNGILPTIFNYGSLHIETAGEQNNFVFHYCPNPNAYAKAILDARTHFVTQNGHH
jgi:uncharacterized membrane protein YdbT with pleckstrin-like domain